MYALDFIRPLPKRNRIPLSRLITGVGEKATALLESMLHFDTKERVSASEALTSQYLFPYHDSTDEPTSTELFKWSFSEVDLSIEDWKLILYTEVLSFHEQAPAPPNP
ncbi:hypothetical protein N7505_001418 [Penicillium chrysogenum]|uniref:Protein kinase domain-containing protein n=1 Tax=Penicillium chrysogenum TaxID=5076 RepID=A0ABQ8WWL5_PENCH|nr:hypothetical protein N7505_001418 [Penicillium chrysogenum]